MVVLENVLCRGLGLAALADRVDHDVQQQQHNGHDHDEHGKLALAPVAAGQRLLLVDVLLVLKQLCLFALSILTIPIRLSYLVS